MRNPKIAVVRYVQPNGRLMILQVSLKLQHRSTTNFRTMNVCPTMQYCDVITNPRWWTAAILEIAKSPYLSEKSSDFDKIWYTTADIEHNDSHVMKNKLFKIQDCGLPSCWKSFLVITHRQIVWLYKEVKWQTRATQLIDRSSDCTRK